MIVTTSDDDTAGFSLNKTRATVSEDGTSAVDTFSVVLNSQPLSNVVLELSLSADPDAAVSPSRVTFTPQNWDTAQTVDVTGLDDDVDDDNEETTISVTVDAANSDDSFDAVDGKTLVVTTLDDDAAGFLLNKVTATVSEDGVTLVDAFTVVLTSQPVTDVMLAITTSADPDVAADRNTVTFTRENWNDPQPVELAGLDDDVDDGDEETTISVTVDAANSDDSFDAVDGKTLVVTTLDDDAAGFLLNKVTATVSEDGVTLVDAFTVVLTSQPVTDVMLAITTVRTRMRRPIATPSRSPVKTGTIRSQSNLPAWTMTWMTATSRQPSRLRSTIRLAMTPLTNWTIGRYL